jgi:hypothetical protein
LAIAAFLIVLAAALALWNESSRGAGGRAAKPPRSGEVAGTPPRSVPSTAELAFSREALDAEAVPDAERATPAEPYASTERSEERVVAACVPFDGHSMNGWTGPGKWTVADGVLEYAAGTELGETLESSELLPWPCEISMEVQLIGRQREDARGFWLKNGDNEIHVRIDNSPDEFQLKVRPEEDTRSAQYPLSESEWYELRCRVEANGTVRAWIDGTNELSVPWSGRFPLTLGLCCQRSGGRYRSILVTKLDATR